MLLNLRQSSVIFCYINFQSLYYLFIIILYYLTNDDIY